MLDKLPADRPVTSCGISSGPINDASVDPMVATAVRSGEPNPLVPIMVVIIGLNNIGLRIPASSLIWDE